MGDDNFLDWVRVAAATAAGERCAAPDVVPLRVEASTRSFFRVTLGASSFIAMHSPPGTENNPRYVFLAALLRRHGLATPQIHATDMARGYLLVEDLGSTDFEAAYAGGEVDAPLTAALSALVKLQAVPDTSGIEAYTVMRFHDELTIFEEHLIRQLLDLPVVPGFAAVRQALVAATQSVPQCVVHRDFHCRNLIWRAADASVGVVDFQDALIGPCCYDLASLLRDCYHTFDEAAVAAWRRRFFALAALDCDESAFNRAFDLVTMQRQLKAVGIFARLHLSRGRSSHLGDILPVLRRITALAPRYAETRALAEWLRSEVLPAANRRLAALAAA